MVIRVATYFDHLGASVPKFAIVLRHQERRDMRGELSTTRMGNRSAEHQPCFARNFLIDPRTRER